ncbi:hypothetical protein T10_5135 [Trichinella papuae]|uniref:Uncharacterized protein n=1 Tax=Trichinella papuae TaxID=268474 RepID=A0A0V1M330_9BILA|nr:hypothetical protein T10_721 [Trichinella papuae]KRZ66261.1 hypothetical protein T10_6432 [Trichinella papuae]KRZ67744.1 hypothetical protein T10_5135 [Trichinella papuae]
MAHDCNQLQISITVSVSGSNLARQQNSAVAFKTTTAASNNVAVRQFPRSLTNSSIHLPRPRHYISAIHHLSQGCIASSEQGRFVPLVCMLARHALALSALNSAEISVFCQDMELASGDTGIRHMQHISPTAAVARPPGATRALWPAADHVYLVHVEHWTSEAFPQGLEAWLGG